MNIKEDLLAFVQSDESDLPALSIVVDKIIGVACDPDSTARELADVISFDQGMANKLLRLANSIYYAQRTKVDTIKRAVAVIGFDEIIGIALGMEVISAVTKNEGFGMDLKNLWMHAIGVGVASKEISRQIAPEISAKVFVPGLLHDMGKVVFTVYFKDAYRKVQQFAMENQQSLAEAENAVCHLDHAQLSGLLMTRWNFPQSIVIPCRFHHDPGLAPPEFSRQAFIVHFADYITHRAGVGHSGNPVPAVIKKFPANTGITQAVIKHTIDRLRQKEDEVREFLHITTG